MNTYTVSINESKLRTLFGLRRFENEQIQLLEEYTKHIECTNFCEAIARLYEYYINDLRYSYDDIDVNSGQLLFDNLVDIKEMSVNKQVKCVDVVDMYININEVFDLLTTEVLCGELDVRRLLNVYYNRGHILCRIIGK